MMQVQHQDERGNPQQDREGNDSLVSVVGNASAYPPVVRSLRKKDRRRISGNSDSKQTEAAALAVNLSSAGSWSDTFMGDSSGIPTNSDSLSPEDSIDVEMLSVSNLPQPHSHPSIEDSGLGPPPEYTPAPEREVSVESHHNESEDMHFSTVHREMTEQTSTYREPNSQHGADQPLLSESNDNSRKLPDGPEEIVSQRKRRSMSWIAAIGILLMIFIVGGVVYKRMRHGHSSHMEDLPFIPTDRVYVHHDPYEGIKGRFNLYDRLELSTTTGDIDVQIDLQPGNDTAELILTSSTGTIKLGVSDSWRFRKDRCYRPIHTEIKTVTGDVKARILLGDGGSTLVETVSGSQDVWVYVFGASKDDRTSHLITRSHIGKQSVDVFNYAMYRATLENLSAQHESLGTADLDIKYSDSWEGEVHAVTTAVGPLKVEHSQGLVVDKEEQNEVLAHKGSSNNPAKVSIVGHGTGSIIFGSYYKF